MIVTLSLMLSAAVASPAEEPRGCDAKARSAVSSEADRPLTHIFQNGHTVPLQLWWIDPDAKRVDLGTIAPGGYKSMQTYQGHIFVLTDPRRRCRAAIRIDDVNSGSYVGTSRHRPVPLHGWPVSIDRALDPAAEPARTALATLAGMLREAESVLPPAALRQVRRTPIYLLEHSGPGGMYHQNPDWLIAHGRTVEMVHAIEISDASLLPEIARVQPGAVLHELAHAYYWKLPAADLDEVDSVYRTAMAGGRYLAVERHDGSIGRAYASTDRAEYFAELSEAWFGRNDFFPFTRSDLESHDPEGARLMERIWR